MKKPKDAKFAEVAALNKKVRYFIWAVSLLPLFLPWFSFNIKVTTGCWGYSFLPELLVPIILISASTFVNKKYSWILGTLGNILYIGVLILAIGMWQERTNILEGMNWTAGINTFLWGYWVSIVCVLIFTVVHHIAVFKRAK